tara:strand:+ start:83486 stop:84091 length:606 start_codon:yes stop_codon:yes gene_type:complete
MTLTPQLVVMAKRPEMGRVKTRLAKGLGQAGATRFYRQTTQSLMRRVGTDPRWQTLLALSPDRAVFDTMPWPGPCLRVGQGRGDLGHRMGRLMRDLPAGPVVIIGSDIPDISARHIAAAFRALGRNDAVFGPSADGGYWLVGLKRVPRVRDIFGQVHWSTDRSLEDTLRNVRNAGMRVAMLDVLHDIDTLDDFKSWKDRQP